MPNIELSLAISCYDHVADLVNGCVCPQGISLTSMEFVVEEIFFRMLSFVEFDIAEFSMAKYVSLVASKSARFRAIPVFPSRVFRQSALYVASRAAIADPKDLIGRRIGIPEWAQTAGIYVRAYLQHQCDIRLADIQWVQAGVNQAGRAEKVAVSLPNGVKVKQVKDRSLNEMLLAGELDGIISAREPAAFLARDPRIVRLWPVYRSIEESYYKQTGIFPIMHVIVIKEKKLEVHPWIAMNLFKAFEAAKANSLRRLSSVVNSQVAIPWSHDAVEKARVVIGDDFWPYGVDANRHTLDAFLQYCHEQGVTDRRVQIEELFHAASGTSFKV